MTVGIVELEPDLTTDISAYQSCYRTDTSVNYIEVESGVGSGAGSGEAAMDIENVIGLAPKATIDVFQAPNTLEDLYDEYSDIVSMDTANVVSTSWGLCEPLEESAFGSDENTLFQEAAAQGQSVFAAAGDTGGEDAIEPMTAPAWP